MKHLMTFRQMNESSFKYNDKWAESNGLETHIAAEFGDGNPDYSRLEGFLEDHDGSDFVSLSMIFPLAASRPI